MSSVVRRLVVAERLPDWQSVNRLSIEQPLLNERLEIRGSGVVNVVGVGRDLDGAERTWKCFAAREQ